MKTKEELIFQALGAASMCWTGAPSGTFDSTRCKQIGDELIAALENAEALKPSHNKPMAGAEPPQITPCPCEKDALCLEGKVDISECPKYNRPA